MVFWGIVVKPGAPFTLSRNRRLHLSQATLGVGSATTKSIVQCNVGDKTSVFLCTLVPEKMESCPLNLKYEEAVTVVFSVIGSLSVHLTGYFEENTTNIPNNDDDDKTESFGEDIPDTETERSDFDDDDEYGGSFINDGDIEVFPTSPSIEVGKISVRKKSRKLKKCSIVESDDDDDCSPITATSKLLVPSAEVDETSSKKEGGKSMNDHIVESAKDDRSPVTAPRHALSNAEVDETSSKKEGGKSMNGHIAESANDDRSPVTAPRHALPNAEVDETSSEKDDTELMKCHTSEPNNDSCPPVNATTQLFGIFDVSDSEEDDTRPIGTRLRHKSAFRSLNFDSVCVERETVNSKNNLTENELGTLTLSPENDLAALKPERDAGMESDFGSEHKEEQLRELKSSKSVNNLSLLDQNSVDNGDSPVPKIDIKTDDVDAGKSLEGIVDNNVRIDHKCHHPEEAKEILENSIDDSGQEKHRKKKKRKTAEDCCTDVISEVDKALKNGKLDSDDQQKGRKRKKRKGFNIKDVDKSKTLGNGLVIEEQEIGNPDGKIATTGKRVSVHYVVKSLESGQVLSNPDQAPLKFKLGSEGHDGWELGIEGMRVGGKRRILVPPSLCLSTEGASGEVSLVHEVELVNVR